MREGEYLEDLRRTAGRNNVRLPKDSKLAALFGDEISAGAVVRNVYREADAGGFLVLSSSAVTSVRSHLRGPRVEWTIPHTDLTSASTSRRIGAGNALFMDVVFRTASEEHEFTVGMAMPDELQRFEVVQQNADIIVDEVTEVAQASKNGPASAPPAPSSGGSPFTIDPGGPERRGEQARSSYGHANFADALGQYESAIEALHDLYLIENMRQRQPGPADAWIVDGYTSSLGAALSTNPNLDVTESVRTVTHRLRTIASKCRAVGSPEVLYMGALQQMATYAPHVNVDDILWN